jgi:mono/diheme cytochrome c family protein
MIPAGCHVQSALTPQQAEGERLYDAGCAHCHEENDLHLKTVPPNLHGLFSRKTLPDGAPATDAEVERVLFAGKGMMPSFAYQMTRQQMDDVVAYLHTMKPWLERPTRQTRRSARDHPNAKVGSFSETAAFGQVVVVAVKGSVASDVLRAAGSANLDAKLVMAACNPIADGPPTNGVLKRSTNRSRSGCSANLPKRNS